MNKSIDFYFEYSSPFGYLASERIEAIARKHSYHINWHPVLLGAIFKITEQRPLTMTPLKGDYSLHDFARSAREHKLDYTHPDPFPIAAVSACRATLWLRDNDDAELQACTTHFIKKVYRAFYAEGRDITDTSVLAEIANSLNVSGTQLIAALAEQSVKDALKTEIDDAVSHGVFGSPMMIVDGEPFWGHDRLEQMDNWIASGGW